VLTNHYPTNIKFFEKVWHSYSHSIFVSQTCHITYNHVINLTLSLFFSNSISCIIQRWYITSSYLPWFWQRSARLFNCFATSGWSRPSTWKQTESNNEQNNWYHVSVAIRDSYSFYTSILLLRGTKHFKMHYKANWSNMNSYIKNLN